MTPEDHSERFERQMEFLVEQSAKNTVQIEQLTDLVMRLGRVVEEQGRQTDGHFVRLDAALRSLAESQQRTDERLNALFMVVERYFSHGRH